jgi:ABC-type Fe3+ transport system permease subunit
VVGARRAGIVAVVLAALTMGLAFAHTLELPQKLDNDAATWTQIQHTLYRYFAVIGGPLEVATIIAAVVFAVRARGRRGGRPPSWAGRAWAGAGGACGHARSGVVAGCGQPATGQVCTGWSLADSSK